MNRKKPVYILSCMLLAEMLTAPAINADASGNPVLMLRANGKETYTAKAGETVYISYEISGGSSWSTSGIHFNYDARLLPAGDNEGNIYYSKGESVSDSLTVNVYHRTGVDINKNIIRDNPEVPDISPYVSPEQNCIFVTTFAKENAGTDGTLIGVNMTIPEDAQEGDEYKCNFWFIDSDQFTDCGKDSAMQEYAFSHYSNCTIKVGGNIIKGDVNNDGSVEMADIVAVAAYIGDSKANPLDGNAIIAGDVHNTGDGLTVGDVLMLQQYIADITDSPE